MGRSSDGSARGQGSPQRWTDPQCPVARTVDLIGDRWSLLIVRDAFDGARSFTELRRRLGVAKNILADRLRRLGESGILARETAASGRRQEYVLTEAGRELFTLIVALRQWGENYAFNPGEEHSVLVDETSGSPVPELRLESPDGTPLTARNTHVRNVT